MRSSLPRLFYLCPFLTSTADTQANPTSDFTAHQRISMLKVIYSHDRNTPDMMQNIDEYLYTQDFSYNDPCTWNGVTCRSGTVVSFVMTAVQVVSTGRFVPMFQVKRWTVDMDWLPGSIEVIHLRDILYLKSFCIRRLPRDLRYLCLISCDSTENTVARQVDVRNLPRQMEYVYLKDGWFSGPVYIDQLPPKLKFLNISHYSIGTAYIKSVTLPKSLECIFIERTNSFSRKTAIYEISGGDVDPRVQTYPYLFKLSAEHRAFEAALDEHAEDFQDSQRWKLM